MSEKFCLKWNDFHSNASKSFGIFRNEEYLHDVTLVSDDHNKVSAHRLVLSACSDYFRNIFKNNQHSHPLLCLEGVSSEDLKNIMDYIYNGEVMVYQDNLDKFLSVAQRLKLEGLMSNNTEEIEELDDNKSSTNEFIKNAEKQEPTFISEDIEFNNSDNTVKRKRQQNPIGTVQVASNVDADEQISQYMEVSSDGSYRCTVCGKSFGARNKKQDAQRHIETHIEGLSYECPICQKTFRSKNALYKHKEQKHNKNISV